MGGKTPLTQPQLSSHCISCSSFLSGYFQYHRNFEFVSKVILNKVGSEFDLQYLPLKKDKNENGKMLRCQSRWMVWDSWYPSYNSVLSDNFQNKKLGASEKPQSYYTARDGLTSFKISRFYFIGVCGAPGQVVRFCSIS